MENLFTQIDEEFDEKYGDLIKKLDSYYGDGKELMLYPNLKKFLNKSNLRVKDFIIEATREWANDYFLKNHNHHEEESGCVDSNYPYINSLKMEEDLKQFLSTLIEHK